MKAPFHLSSVQLVMVFCFVICSFTVTAQVQDSLAPDGRYSTQKGNVLISTTFSVKHSESENEPKLLQPLDESYRLNWNVTLRSGYFIKDNFALGGYFKYSNKLDRLEYSNDQGLILDNSLARAYSIAPFMRNYLPLGKGSIYLFNETNLEFTYGSEVRQVENPAEINRTTSDSFELKLGIQPGIAVFITDLVSAEIGTSVLGLSSKYTRFNENGDEDNEGYTFENEVSFEIDLLSLFLGITFYFPTK